MLDSRKKEILNLLLHSNGYFSVDSLAKRVGVSEKTIRTDLKGLDEWLSKYPDVQLIRKPSLGVILQGSDQSIRALRREIEIGGNTPPTSLSQENRKVHLIKLLLENDKVFTMQQLAERFYVSKTTISYDLAEVEAWLNRMGLRLVKKTNFGLKVEGDERAWRTALSKVVDLSRQREKTSFTSELMGDVSEWMAQHELAMIESRVRDIERWMDFRFTDQAIINLIIHLAIAIKRIKLKKKIPMPEHELSKLQEKAEYDLAKKLVKSLEQTFAVSFPETEVGYVTLHLLGAKIRYDEESSTKQLEQSLEKIDPQAVQMAKRIIEQVDQIIQQSLLLDEELLVGLSIHLHSALNRLKHGLSVTNPILQEIKQMYRYTFEAVFSVIPSMEQEIGVKVPEDEVGYITLHFQAALVRKENVRTPPKTALIVCSTGTGTSQLLASKLKQRFPTLHVLKAISQFDLKSALQKYQVDVVISTIPLPSLQVQTLLVSPLLTNTDQAKIEAVLEHHSQNGSPVQSAYPTLKQKLTQELIFLDVEATSRFEVIDFLAEQLTQKKCVKKEYKESAMQREWMSSTAIGGGIAIPHGRSEYIEQSAIAVARMGQSIEWGGEQVSLVFMLALHLSEREQVQKLFEEMTALVDDPVKRSLLKEQPSIEAFLENL